MQLVADHEGVSDMTRQYVSNEELVQVPQYRLDELRYNPDPMTRLRAEAESHRRMDQLLTGAAATAAGTAA